MEITVTKITVFDIFQPSKLEHLTQILFMFV